MHKSLPNLFIVILNESEVSQPAEQAGFFAPLRMIRYKICGFAIAFSVMFQIKPISFLILSRQASACARQVAIFCLYNFS